MEKLLHKIETVISCVMLYTVLFIIVLGVTQRYILNSPIIWVEEASNMIYVWIVFIGAVISYRDGKMITMDFIYDLFSTNAKKIVDLLFNLIIVVTSIYLIPKSFSFLKTISKVETMILKISWGFLFWPLLFIFIALALLGIVKIFRIFFSSSR